MGRRAEERIPKNVLDAARRAGLGLPHWYVGRRADSSKPRRKTLSELADDIEAERDRGQGDGSVRRPR